MSPRKIERIVIHCSALDYGCLRLIDHDHRQRGWNGCGYHIIINNAYENRSAWLDRKPNFRRDGMVELGRPLDEIGAHVKGKNSTSVGICLIGNTSFTGLQFRSLFWEVERIRKVVPDIQIVGHYELDSKKTCPNISGDWLRCLLMEVPSRFHSLDFSFSQPYIFYPS